MEITLQMIPDRIEGYISIFYPCIQNIHNY